MPHLLQSSLLCLNTLFSCNFISEFMKFQQQTLIMFRESGNLGPSEDFQCHDVLDMEVDAVGAKPHGDQIDFLMQDSDEAASCAWPLTIMIPPVRNYFSYLFLI